MLLRHVFRRRIVLAAAISMVAAIAGWWTYAKAQPTVKQAPRPNLLADVFPMPAEYAVHDGKVVHDASSDQPTKDEPAKVDTLNLRAAYERAQKLSKETQGKVFKATIEPHWFKNNTRFWYRNDLKGGAKEFIFVDAEKGTRGPAFDHAKLAAALSKADGGAHSATRLPFSMITFSEDDKAITFTANGRWRCDLTTYECARLPKSNEEEEPAEPALSRAEADEESAIPDEAPFVSEEEMAFVQKKGGKKGFPPPATREARSADGKWLATIKDYNVILKDKDGKESILTKDGVAGNAFDALAWAPDSKTLVAYRTEPGDNKQIHMIETSPKDQLPTKLHTRAYPRPGDKFNQHEMWIVPIETKKPIKVDVERINFRGLPRLRWSKDSTRFTFEKTDRGHQRFRIIEVEAASGKTRNILDEKATTFIDRYSYSFLRYLDDTGEIIYSSEMDGWKHLYLIDAKTGNMKQITKGEYVLRGVDKVDVVKRQIWFQASGMNKDHDPYFIHYYRIDFDGAGLVALTESNGDHWHKDGPQYSPDGKHAIVTWSRVDQAPVHELRRVSDGKLICKIDEADISALEATGWKAPEVFVSKARDGKTDIWGIVHRPRNFDPNKKYPVIEYIYAGPHGSFVPKRFAAYRQQAALAELGFIVVQIDGMGTAHRSRAFHDVCWKNVGDAGFPDRILWMKALAKRYAYVDITRVGIYGTSAGGQSSTGALLFHPDFYKVAVSSCGCHDNRLDKDSWNEQWMGLMGPHYEAQSNVTNAHKLQGKLFLIVGELDTNVPFESTMRVVDALVRARKDFDLLVVPGMGHSDGGPYGERRRWDYFVRHLHGVEPPERNR
jgi:dipeptidyl aminopeptidase/acylaminoacyl peptidase